MLRSPSIRTLLFPSVSFALALASFGQTIVLEPVKDNTLYQQNQGMQSNGAGDSIRAGRTAAMGANAIRRGLLAFDFSAIPPGATITSVSLQLTATMVGDPTPYAADLHRMLADWGEGTSLGRGIGSTPTTGDATWIHSFYPGTFWSTAGGEFFPGVRATTDVLDVGVYTWSSPEMVIDVQAWYDNPAINFGWMLRGVETITGTARAYGSREATTVANRPKLTVTYDAPCTTTAAGATRNGGTNPLSLTSSTMVLGGTFSATVDNALAGQATSVLFGFDTPFNLTLAGGQTLLCLDFGSGEVLSGAGLTPSGGGAGMDTFSLSIPNDTFLCGFEVCVQAIQFGSPPFVLSNARDLTLGN